MSKKIITIGREFGSGGREIGLKLSKALHIPCYDRRLIEMAAEEIEMDVARLEQVDETSVNRWLYSVPNTTNPIGGYGLPLNDTVFMVQSRIIKKLAQTGSCIIVGRCADYVLNDFDNCMHVFICAPREDKIRRVMQRLSLSEAEAKDLMQKTDKRRKAYYNFYTDRKWGMVENHDLVINSSMLGLDGTAELLKECYKLK